MHPMLNIAIRAVRKGGSVIVQNYDTQNFIKEDIEKKNIFIENIMYKTYKTISQMIYKSYPNHIIVNKNQKNLSIKNENNTIWIINELDGKNNFIRHFPHFCISIAVIVRNKIEISVVYDPIRNDLFTAVKGQGSQLNGYRTRCSNIKTLKYTTVAVNLPEYIHDRSSAYFEIYKKLILCGILFRCTGSTVLDLAYVAAGRIDCLFDFNLEPSNFIAGKLQVREAGCLISDFTGGHEHNNCHSGNLISSPKFVRLITEKMREYFLL
ncbi:inositol monophosphatase family protein [Buchnera aphidicola]|uniref:Inositol-1-monophosphatase n=1 Tax=Buchnera aphidicola str. USDA (Myzus persicae) TaxID=1009856 RepID=W0P3S3_BUCMP|nr:inositol monophosphatase family protein [Buchnera aphidicola]AHG60097.1 Suhb [Buchnera aphidicola str. USDA (Myzus persicae)]AHG60677.1 Suhb [Buchnera aphidicola str. W106 (Myzus persicae)]AHG61249.1 Suhb [Buchnera aphidicola str. G002 (Myzus persicae)]AHG61822.1 Suhb [Buchnera aphidicola str. F009 (Myzus persicae)]WAI03214.1 MAG: inositol monophosphatase [Buchnera aphidicola (Myzus persicae)]